MDAGLFAQYVMNGLMLGMMYALVAVGFTLFFGVLDVIKFSHGDVLTVGAFTALATFIGLTRVVSIPSWLDLLVMLVVAIAGDGVLGMLIARYLVLPLRSAPALNTLLITLMLGTVLRESVRLFYPDGANPKPFPRLLPTISINFGNFNLRLDNALMLAAGVARYRRPAISAQPDQARSRHPRRGARRGDRDAPWASTSPPSCSSPSPSARALPPSPA